MRAVAAALLALTTLATGCPPPAALTPNQWAYVRGHPELGEPGRAALLDRAIAVGQTLERVRIAWDGLVFEPRGHKQGDRVQTYSVRIPIGDRPVQLRGLGNPEEVQGGHHVLLTFRDGLLVAYVSLE